MNNSTLPALTVNTVIALLEPHIPNITADDIYSLAKTVKSDDKLLTVKEAATFFNVCNHTIRRMIKADKIKGFKIGGSLRVSHNSLKELLEGLK